MDIAKTILTGGRFQNCQIAVVVDEAIGMVSCLRAHRYDVSYDAWREKRARLGLHLKGLK